MIKEVQNLVAGEFRQLVQQRRYLHQNPCLSFCEEDTREYLCHELSSMDIPWRICGKNGILAWIDGDCSGPVIAFRADFDALAIQEPEGLEYASKVPGVMHACGHDAHGAILLSLARVFRNNKNLVLGKAVFIFQYAEELPPGGAAPMIEAGCLEGVDKIYGLHVSDDIPTGTIGICSGKYMASADNYGIDFWAGGGHGAMPWKTPDTISAATIAVTQINSIISKFIMPNVAAVVNVCNIHGGTSYNVIPNRVHLEGTVRSFEKETAELIRRQLEQIARAAASVYGTEYEFNYYPGYPPVVNHAHECDIVRQASSLQEIPVAELSPTLIGEDFSYYLEKVPGAFFRIGTKNEESGCVYPLHDSRFMLDEDALAVGLQAFLEIYLLETDQEDEVNE